MKIKTLLMWAISAFFAVMLSACNKEPQQIAFEGKTMGTTYHIKYIDDGSLTNLPKPEEVQRQMDTLLKMVNNEMSTYQKDSQISQFNQMKEADKPFEIASDFAKVAKEAVRLNKVTEGALDVTVGPLVNLWGFGPDKRLNKAPTEEQIAERATWVGIEKLVLDDNATKATLTKKVPELYLDLSAIAKGFGVDKLADYLEQLGVQHYLVEIGGELRGKGLNLKGQPWRIAVEKPEFAQGTSSQIVVPLHNLGMATSGNYRNYFEDEQGNRLSHIIDPKALRPISHNLASITVFAPTTMTADGLSTGLYVLGAEKALEVAERENLAIFLIIKKGDGYETKMSSAFEKLINQK
ncbi:FAD:protein FMN transferase [Glaesserella parasuis]|uniref:FAD:protein FMN transferase n=1 Tax=Glaesserella parasuis TaxID=738 RepID=UPI0013654A6E|nr:FAD:protein FMN transferase [Glaesserella parasuis]MDG6465768.1 FAD:protein FMN transferase [Glaesserella parasuis]MDO9746524.1 FAD:protein FMN transferase [Glaesserella parasuis]MDO9770775.1 FAD:protein FMN transferase [Glaesserella parasuis]MDO9772858.1 FAD:protein FMN transferase [Glaesserella parasuis]MDO9802513.1 FAD:protein FMN transferase [Glaesserella parasuis]